MSEIEKRVIKGFNVDKATEDQLNDLSSYELVDIVLFFREQLHHYKQVVKEIKEIAESCSYNNGESLLFSRMEQIMQKCEEVNNE